MASALSYLVVNYAQEMNPPEIKVGLTFENSGQENAETENPIPNDLGYKCDCSMRSALAALIFFIGLLTLLLVTCFFTEIPIEQRRRQKKIKRKVNDMEGLELKVLVNVEQYTLAGSDEWIRMKQGPPNENDVQATLHLYFVVSLMYAVPLAIVGLQLVLIGADAFEISKCFLVASSASLVGLILCWKCASCCKPSTLVTAGLTIGLVSAFFLLDYKASNSTEEKMETRGKVLTDLMIGLVLTTIGHTVARCGLETQLLQLMPKSQYLCY